MSDKNTFAPLLKAYMIHRDNSIKEAVGTVYEEKFARMAEKMVFCDAAASAVLLTASSLSPAEAPVGWISSLWW